MTWLRSAVGDLRATVTDLVAEDDRVGVFWRIEGVHRGTLFGVPPTGRHVWWHCMPLFTFDGDRVRDLWVLGDIHGLIRRLKGDATPSDERPA